MRLSDEEPRGLAEEQTALRRVATLVARGRRYVHLRRRLGRRCGPVSRWQPVEPGGKNIATLVFETGRPARIDGYADASGSLGARIRERGVRSAAGTPVIVEGRLWGLVVVGSRSAEPLPAATEARLASFTGLVATAIANAESRAELMTSRARIVAAADEVRRRIERDLHDGTQHQLVSLMLELRAVQAAVPAGFGEIEGGLARIAVGLADVFDRVREISRGIHPAIMSEKGLASALRALARRSPVPVELDLRAGLRLPGAVEVAAYYAVSEAVANAAKHACASAVQVELGADEAMVRLTIRDDGDAAPTRSAAPGPAEP